MAPKERKEQYGIKPHVSHFSIFPSLKQDFSYHLNKGMALKQRKGSFL